MRVKTSVVLLAVFLLLGLVACGGGGNTPSVAENGGGEQAAEPTPASTGDPVAGEALFNQVCIACHGAGGVGVENLGKPFTTSDFIATHSDAELLDFVKTGRPISDPENTTGVDMPPKGGNPALTDEQIMDIIAYIRTLHE